MNRNPLKIRSVKLGIAAVAITSTLGLTAGLASADEGPDAASAPATTEGVTLEGPADEMAAEFPGDDFAIDEAWIAAEQATEDELAALLDSKSIAYTRENDGFVDRVVPTWVDDEAATQAMADVIDDFYWSKNPVSAEDIAISNAEQLAFNEAMLAKGVATKVTTDRHGFTVVEITDYNDAAIAAIDEYYAIGAGDIVE